MKHKKIILDGRYVPVRMCVACRGFIPQIDLIRVVKSADGEIVVDLSHKAQGRGAYICRNNACIEKAQKIRGLERGLKSAVAKEVYEECCTFEK